MKPKQTRLDTQMEQEIYKVTTVVCSTKDQEYGRYLNFTVMNDRNGDEIEIIEINHDYKNECKLNESELKRYIKDEIQQHLDELTNIKDQIDSIDFSTYYEQ